MNNQLKNSQGPELERRYGAPSRPDAKLRWASKLSTRLQANRRLVRFAQILWHILSLGYPAYQDDITALPRTPNWWRGLAAPLPKTIGHPLRPSDLNLRPWTSDGAAFPVTPATLKTLALSLLCFIPSAKHLIRDHRFRLLYPSCSCSVVSSPCDPVLPLLS